MVLNSVYNMANEDVVWDFSSQEITSSPVPESPQEASYIPVRVLGKGAFGEAVLYRKTEVKPSTKVRNVQNN
jgi:hypothetical protein